MIPIGLFFYEILQLGSEVQTSRVYFFISLLYFSIVIFFILQHVVTKLNDFKIPLIVKKL